MVCYPEETVPAASPSAFLTTSLTTKHCNSFNSEILEESPNTEHCDKIVVSSDDKRLSADSVSVLGKYKNDFFCTVFHWPTLQILDFP